jgi:hypothetical protein
MLSLMKKANSSNLNTSAVGLNKRFLFFLSIILFLVINPGSCKKEPICACGVEHPEENLLWLKNILDNSFCTEIYTLFYERIEYLVVCDCPEVVDGMIIFYDCQGNKTCEWGGGGGFCNMPIGFTYEFYEQNKKLIFKQP